MKGDRDPLRLCRRVGAVKPCRIVLVEKVRDSIGSKVGFLKEDLSAEFVKMV